MKIGNLQFDKPIMLAPMEDVTDQAFRLICRRLGADIVYTEFTSGEAIIRHIPRAIRKVKINEEERPVAIQIFGGVEETMSQAAATVEKMKPDFIDINCGCWVKNHVNRGEGAALLKDIKRFEAIVKATIRGTKLPVTVKTRLGWDEDSIVILEVAKMLEQAGVAALTLHCRTRSQAHKAKPDWTWLEKLKKTVSIPIIGNGDADSPENIKRIFETGCDGVMIGRGAIGNPWIFKHSKHYIQTGELLSPPSLKERIDVCLEHLKLSLDLGDKRDEISPFRKYYAGYLHGVANIAKLRADLMTYTEYQPIVDRMYQFLDQSKELELTY